MVKSRRNRNNQQRLIAAPGGRNARRNRNRRLRRRGMMQGLNYQVPSVPGFTAGVGRELAMTKYSVPVPQAYSGNNQGALTGNYLYNYAASNVGGPNYGRGRRGRRVGSSPSSPPQYAWSLLDPFSTEAEGVKVPDPDMQHSFPFHIMDSVIPATDPGTGTFARVISADPSASIYETTTTPTGQSWTWQNNWTPEITYSALANIRFAFSHVRPVAFGVRATTLQSFSTTQGELHVCLFPVDFNQTGKQAAFPLSVGDMMSQPSYASYPLASLISNQCLSVAYPTDDSGYEYRTTQAPWNIASSQVNAGLRSSSGWYFLCIAVTGGVGGSFPVRLSVVVHYEGILLTQGGTVNSSPTTFSAGSNLAIGATPAAASVPTHIAASQIMAEAIPTVRVVDDAGVAELTFGQQFEQWWNLALLVANGALDAAAFASKVAGFFI